MDCVVVTWSGMDLESSPKDGQGSGDDSSRERFIFMPRGWRLCSFFLFFPRLLCPPTPLSPPSQLTISWTFLSPRGRLIITRTKYEFVHRPVKILIIQKFFEAWRMIVLSVVIGESRSSTCRSFFQLERGRGWTSCFWHFLPSLLKTHTLLSNLHFFHLL